MSGTLPTMSDMPYHSGIEMRAYMSYKQRRLCNANFGASDFVYNRMVALNNERYELKKIRTYCQPIAERLAYVESVLSDLKHFQNSIPFLDSDDIDAQAIANARQNYHKAWNNFKKNPASGIPVFHKRGYERSYQTNAHYKKDACRMTDCNVRFIDRHHIQVPKLGIVKISGSPKRIDGFMKRTSPTRIGTVTIRADSVGRYFISLQLGSTEPFAPLLPSTGSMRGYDVNLENFMTDSDGNATENPRLKRREQEKLSKAQHILSRRYGHAKADGRPLYASKNYQSQRRKVALLHSRTAAGRQDLLHVLSKREVESQDFLFHEDLRIKNMVKNHKLAYAVSDVSWGTFFNFLSYKAKMYGKTCEKVPAPHTSQTCSDCGYVLQGQEKLTLKDREWVCPNCGVRHLRDHNSARVVLARGMASLGL